MPTLFDSWDRLAELAVVLVVSYGVLVAVLRISGKRTLAKLNAFDFVVTIALGSMLASIITSRDLALVEGLVALGGLVALQYLVAGANQRWNVVHRVIKSEPTALVVDGRLRHDAMARCRVSRGELAAAVRKHGLVSFELAGTVVLEADGTFSVLSGANHGDALDDVEGVG
jgi:uncharacterized membrane protein YcaP (DUF421 family)